MISLGAFGIFTLSLGFSVSRFKRPKIAGGIPILVVSLETVLGSAFLTIVEVLGFRGLCFEPIGFRGQLAQFGWVLYVSVKIN